MRDIAFVAGLVAMLTFVIGRPQIGVLLWAWTAFLVPNAFLFGFAQSLPFNYIVALVTLMAWLLSKERSRVPLNATTCLLVLFGALGTVSAASAIGSSTVAWAEWEKFAKVILFSLVVSAIVNTRTRYIGLCCAISLSLGFHGLIEGLKFIVSGGAHRIVEGPGSSIIADNNHFALAMLCTGPLLFFLYQQADNRLVRLAICSCSIVLLFAVVGTFSRGGLIGLAAVLVLALIRGKRRIRSVALVTPVLLVALIFAPDRWFDRMDTISEAVEDSSFMNRVTAWKQSTLIALDNPIVGGGFHAVQDHSVWGYYSANRFDRLDFIPSPQANPDRGRAAHSIYFQVVGDLGFFGLAIFIALGCIAWRNAAFVHKRAQQISGLEWASQLALCLQYSLFAYYVAGAALSMAYFELIYVFFGALASLRLLVARASTGREHRVI